MSQYQDLSQIKSEGNIIRVLGIGLSLLIVFLRTVIIGQIKKKKIKLIFLYHYLKNILDLLKGKF